jgi:hypothetical protein
MQGRASEGISRIYINTRPNQVFYFIRFARSNG